MLNFSVKRFLLNQMHLFAEAPPAPRKQVLMVLGGFEFVIGLNSYQKIGQKNSYRQVEQKILRGSSVFHSTGENAPTLTLSGTILSNYDIGIDAPSLDDLRNLAKEGKAHLMVDELGEVHGKYVITDITEEKSLIDKKNVARKTSFSVTLKEVLA